MWNSLRGRLATVASALALLFLFMWIYTQNLVHDTRSDSRDLINQYYGAHKYLEDAKDALRRLESAMFL